MRINTLFFLLIIFSIGCTSSKDPDVSKIKVDIPIERFDKSFFSIDTNNTAAGLKELMKEHPDFYTDFMQQILGVSGSDTNKVTLDVSKFFIRGYSSMYQSLSKQYSDINWLQKDIQKAFQYVKYYFPQYKTSKIILFLGPLDAPGVALTDCCAGGKPRWKETFTSSLSPVTGLN